MPTLRTRKPEPVPVLDPSTQVVCTTPFRPGAIARMIERGQSLRLDNPVVRASPEFFAIPLNALPIEIER
jgi:hypothetical protein